MIFKTVFLKDITINLDSKRKPLNEMERKALKEKKLYPYCGANGILDYIDEYIFDQEILCIAEDGGSWGYNEKCCYIMNEPCWVNNHAHVLVPGDNVHIKYLYYYLNHVDLTKYITGTTRGKLTKSALEKIQIRLPSISVQNKIVYLLDKVQELIKKRKAQIDALDQLTQSVFLEMLGEPFSNPKGWPKITLKNYVKKIDKVNLKQSQDRIRYIDISSIDNQKNVITSYTEYIGSEAPSRAQQVVQKGDILISTVRPNLKNIAIVQDDLDNLICSTGFCVIRCNEMLNRDFVFHLVKTDSFTKNLVKKTTGANYPAVKASDIYNESIIYPPIKLQEKFSDIIREIDKKKSSLEESLKNLEMLFNSILHRAFKGELFSEQLPTP